MRLYAIPFSTNVERVRLALGHKRVEVETVLVDPEDRAPVLEVSGQPLVPVLVDGDTVVADSVAILAHLDDRFPARPLHPAHPARRAEVLVFVDWFDRVWKGPPNLIAAELAGPRPDHARLAALRAQLRAALDRFDDLLSDRDHLLGHELSVADCVAFPFLRYALRRDPDDDELFHRVLHDEQPLTARHGRLRAWIERMDALPRA